FIPIARSSSAFHCPPSAVSVVLVGKSLYKELLPCSFRF
ncbi:unnamed protein product, partial [Callosobruchus maculatus]